MSGDVLPAGKLPAGLLARFLGGLPGLSDVVVGARPGEDAAVIDVGGRYLILALDPVTLSTEPGRLAVQVNVNDIAVMGGEPRWMLAAIILPVGVTVGEAESIMEQLKASVGEMGVGLIGGHTEISPSVRQPVVAACMVGEVAPDRLVTSAGAQPGDVLLLVGPLAVEGTAILARDEAATLRARHVPDEVIRAAAALLESPGISVLPATRAILSTALPHAMHDPTEGGLLSALRELADASGVGLRVEMERVPVLPSCQVICEALGLNPLGLLASGSVLAAISPADVEGIRQALHGVEIPAGAIGTVTPPEEGLRLVREGVAVPLPEVPRDELARWLEEGR